MSSTSLYDVLEVSPRASNEVIRAAYKSLMQRYHPDRNDDATSTHRSALIAQAYGVLSDPQRRLAYDQSLLTPSATEHISDPVARPTRLSPRAATGQPARLPSWRKWYAPGLIVCIICSSATILWVTRTDPAASQAGSPGERPASPLSTPAGQTNSTRASIDPAHEDLLTSAAVRPTESPAELQARTMSSFALNLAIELIPSDAVSTDQRHILVIPNLGLRLTAEHAAAWTPRIREQRVAIIQRLLVALAAAPYIELVKTDGELYLKNLITETVIATVGLAQSAATATPSHSLPVPQRPLEVLLPLSFSVR